MLDVKVKIGGKDGSNTSAMDALNKAGMADLKKLPERLKKVRPCVDHKGTPTLTVDGALDNLKFARTACCARQATDAIRALKSY